MRAPGHIALGTWSGGRFMHYGEPLSDDRLEDLLRPGDDVSTVLTADVYGEGEADRLLGRALAGVPRGSYCLVGAIGHDFYAGERDGPRGFPRFTDPGLRDPDGYADYVRMATEQSLERCGVDSFDLLLLHNPDRAGFTSEAVWDALETVRAEGLTESLGVAPGPANGFTLDLLDCFERFGERIDWAMVILGPLEPWPGELVLEGAQRAGVRLITRVVDYGGLFFGDVPSDGTFGESDHRRFRPAGWVDAGRLKLERLRPIADRRGLTPFQLAASWNLAHQPVQCVVPSLIQEAGPDARPVEDKRAELAGVPAESPLGPGEMAEVRAVGDNSGSMALKGASTEHQGDERPDRWPLSRQLANLGRRFGIDPEHDLVKLG